MLRLKPLFAPFKAVGAVPMGERLAITTIKTNHSIQSVSKRMSKEVRISYIIRMSSTVWKDELYSILV